MENKIDKIIKEIKTRFTEKEIAHWLQGESENYNIEDYIASEYGEDDRFWVDDEINEIFQKMDSGESREYYSKIYLKFEEKSVDFH